MTTPPGAPARPHSALALLFDLDTGAATAPAVLSAQARQDLDRALGDLPAATREAAVKDVRAAVAGLLDTDVIELLLTGWRKQRDLTSAARRTLAAPGSSEVVGLVEHRITAAWEPRVEVLVNGRQVATVRISVSVVFDVSALLAGISAGRLVKVHAGKCGITATLAIDSVDVATGRTTLELPAVIPVTPGVRLLAAADYDQSARPGNWSEVPRQRRG